MPNALLNDENRILPALVTPLTAEGELDTASLEKLIAHLYDSGVGGLYVGGSTGEGVYLDFPLRRKLTELCVRHSQGRGRVVVHVGAIQARQAIELARHAGDAGADAVSSIPPCFGGYSFAEALEFYRRLASESPAPVVAYYIPGLTGSSFSLDELQQILELPNVAGLKFTDHNFYVMQRLRMRMRDDQIIYNGPDEMLSLGLSMGANGGIGTTYNVMPKQMVAIAGHVAAGEFAEALAVQRQVNEAIEVLLRYGGLRSTKQVLAWQGLIDTPTCAFPRAAHTPQELDGLRRRLAETILGPAI